MKPKNTLFRDPGLKVSATRFVFILWCLSVLVVWIIASINALDLKPIPPSIATILGLLAGGKAVQRFVEGQSSFDKFKGMGNSKGSNG